MLRFDLSPEGVTAALPVAGTAGMAAQSFADLHAHVLARKDLSDSVRKSYLGAINETGRMMNLPLALVPATIDAFEKRFPKDGFDPALKPTESAYQLWRRRVQAALRAFTGAHDEAAVLRAQEDDWSRLIAAIEPLTAGKVGQSAWHPMKLVSIRTFALVARKHASQPRDLDASHAARIDNAYHGNKREANRRAIARLDELRAFPSLLPFLPPKPIGFQPEVQSGREELPAAWETRIEAWIAAVTRGGWDPVQQSFSDDHHKHAHVLHAACRCYFRIAREIGCVEDATDDPAVFLSDPNFLRRIAGEMFARQHRSKKDGRLAPRTSRKYLKGIRQIMAHLGLDTSVLDQILKNNRTAREGAAAERQMTDTNRRFCQALIDQPALRRRFLFSFRALRDAAEVILGEATRNNRPLTPREIERVRSLGTSACFAAIEIGGAPIRIGNAMGLTCIGEDAQIRIPASRRKPITVRIPAGQIKNRRAIAFDIRENRHGCRETISWYLEVIRPLYPHHLTSRYLFPAVAHSDRHLDEGRFGAMFSDHMRIIADLPMTPHQMRHGQVSLMLNAHPGEIEVIAQRIGDTVDTLRRYYGWIDAIRFVERGQDLLVGLMDS